MSNLSTPVETPGKLDKTGVPQRQKLLIGTRIVILFFLLLAFSGQAAERIDVNTAPLEDLTKILHIGPKRAAELISLRPFSSLDDLVRIKNIGSERVEDIKKQGLAWVSSNQSQPQPQPRPETESLSEPKPKHQEKPEKEMAPIVYLSNIIISEILPAPEGPDTKEEWIEIFNQNNFKADLSEWQIVDTIGRTKTYTFPQGTKIPAQGFLLLKRPVSKITLNNDGDGLNLAHPNRNIVDVVNYEKATQGQSYNRIPSGWTWSPTPTPGSENIVPTQKKEGTEERREDTTAKANPPQAAPRIIDINTASSKELQKIANIGPALAQRIVDARPFYFVNELTRVKGIGPKVLEDIEKQGLAWVDPKLEPPRIEKTGSLEPGLAEVAESFKQGGLGGEPPKPLSVFLVAITVATFSGIIILTLKRKLKAIIAK